MKEALSSSETSVITRATRRNIPEDSSPLWYFFHYVKVNFFRAWIKRYPRRCVVARSCIVVVCSLLGRAGRRCEVGAQRSLHAALWLLCCERRVRNTSVALGDASVGNHIYKLRSWITNPSLWKKTGNMNAYRENGNWQTWDAEFWHLGFDYV
jgi:hypothetical protein